MKRNTNVQQRLLSETNLTYAKTVQFASAMELAQQGVDCVSGTDILKYSTTKQHNKSTHHHKHNVSNNKPTKPCFRCDSTDHTPYCKKVGHLQSNCFVKRNKLKELQRSKTMSTFLLTMKSWHIHNTMFPVVQHHTKQISS